MRVGCALVGRKEGWDLTKYKDVFCEVPPSEGC